MAPLKRRLGDNGIAAGLDDLLDEAVFGTLDDAGEAVCVDVAGVLAKDEGGRGATDFPLLRVVGSLIWVCRDPGERGLGNVGREEEAGGWDRGVCILL